MRLINADTLKRKFDQTDLKERGIFPNNLVDSCAEVKAIPIAWIKTYADENHNEEISKMLKAWKDFNKRK